MPITTATITVNFVKYNLPAPHEPIHAFLFDPTEVKTLTAGSGTTSFQVILHLHSNIPGAIMTNVTPLFDEPPEFTATGQDSTTMILAFTNSSEELHLRFSLTVSAGGHSFTSDDPEIEIPPPS